MHPIPFGEAEDFVPLEQLCERLGHLGVRGNDQRAIEVAPQFSVTPDRAMEAAEARCMASDLVAHRVSLAYTGPDLSQQVVANPIGTPEVIRETVAGPAAIGVQHSCGLMFPAKDLGEYREQVAWFAEAAGLTPG